MLYASAVPTLPCGEKRSVLLHRELKFKYLFSILSHNPLYLLSDKSGMGQKAKKDEETSLALL